jgi:hypothetical protein
MQERGAERREFQRLELDPTIPATFGGLSVTLVEIGVLGARIQHTEPIAEPKGDLRFSSKEGDIDLRCQIVRTVGADQAKYPGNSLESGLRFVAAVGESGDRLRTLLAELVSLALEKRNEDSSATRFRPRTVDGDRTVRGVDAQFVCYRFDKDTWKKRYVFLPEQPNLGFTIARSEDGDETHRLCEVYAASDEEGRRLIRLFAELSVSGRLEIPPSSLASRKSEA